VLKQNLYASTPLVGHMNLYCDATTKNSDLGSGKALGFTLVEVMIAMMIALIGMLALGSLTITSLDSNEAAQERTEAVNLGTSIMEDWIASPTDALPIPSCSPALTSPLVAGVHTACEPLASTVKVNYDIYVTVNNPYAFMPVGMPTGSLPVSRKLEAGLRITSILVDRTNSAVLYAGTNVGGLYQSADSGANWVKTSNIGYVGINDIKQDSFGNIYAGTDVGVITNQGALGTWIPKNTGLGNLTVHTLVIDPVTPTTLYAGTNGGVFKSVDGGTTWVASSGNLPTNITNSTVNALVIDPVTPTTLYAGTDVNVGVDPYSGVFKSTDGGVTWSTMKATSPNNVNALAVDPVTPTTLYVGTDVYTATGTVGSGIDSYTSPIGWNVAVSPNDSFTLALTMDTTSLVMGPIPVSGSRGINMLGSRGKGAGVYKGNALRTWFTTHSNQAQRRIYSIAIDSNNPNVWYAGSDGGVLKSTDSGVNWAAINNGLGIVPKEKVVTISWNHKGKTHSIVLTHISRRPY